MTPMTDQRERLGTLIDNHIIASGEEYRLVAQRANISVETLAKARRGEKINTRSLTRIETALGWEQGTASHILAGGNPPPRREACAPSRSQHPTEDDAPAIRIIGTEPLSPGETLEGWTAGDEQTHYRYQAADIEIRLMIPTSTPLEDVARRFRAMASVGRV